jgi:hypothetical protein
MPALQDPQKLGTARERRRYIVFSNRFLRAMA